VPRNLRKQRMVPRRSRRYGPLTAAEVRAGEAVGEGGGSGERLTVCAAWELDGAWDALCAALLPLRQTTKEEK